MISYKYKFVGLLFLVCGFVLAIVNHFHRYKITLPVLAVHSSYIQTKYFTTIITNVFEEIVLILLLAGFLLTVFSKERVELKEFNKMREESWKTALLINSALLAFSILFIYGRGFAAVLILNMFSTFALYSILFLIKKVRLKSNKE
jgi:hypothetical protein